MKELGRQFVGSPRAVAVAVVLVLGLLLSCGGSRSGAPGAVSPDIAGEETVLGTPDGGPDLAMLKDASGAPTGVKVYWFRVDESDVMGYYLYRDTEAITQPDPALRVNGGEIVQQPDESESAVLFDDLFAAEVGTTYYYRVTAVDYGWDESPLSMQRSITISTFSIEGFTPIRGPVGTRVTITGEYFGQYNEQTDAVYFTGVRNDKGPSALYVDDILADILSWENERIEAYVPLGTTIGAITIVSNNTPQETNGDFECTSPYILSVSPDPATAGQEINFYGANFGPPDGMNKLVINDAAYGGLFSSWSNDHVVADLPVDMPTGLVKLELLIGDELTNPYYCDILPADIPLIQKVTPGYGIPGGTGVEILGSNFGEDPALITVLFNGVEVLGTDLDYLSDTVINLTVPVGATRIGEVYVVVDDGISSEESNYYLYHTLPGTVTGFEEGVMAGRVMGEYSDTVQSDIYGTYVIYTDNTQDGGGSLLLAYWDPDIDEWISEVILSTWGEVRWPRIAVDSNEMIHFAYQSYTWTSEVRYGIWEPGVGLISDEQVYSAGSTDTPGDYMDMYLNDDGSGNVDIVLAWSMNETQVHCGYKMSGDSGWTVNTVYTADGAYSEQVGYYCSLDITEYTPPVAPPPYGPSSLGAPARAAKALGGSFIAGITFGLYSPDYSPNHEVRLCYSYDLDTWYSDTDVVGTSSDSIRETVLRWQPGTATQYILWCSDNEINWARDDGGYIRETVTSGDGPYGAAIDLFVDSNGNQHAVGHNGGYTFFVGYRGDPDYTWSLEYVDNDESREPTHVGRGGAQIFADDAGFYGAHFCFYDAAMRDAAFAEVWHDGFSWQCPWYDIADGFATPGYDLSNRAVVCDSSGLPNVVFGDVDPVSGERTLWIARPLDGGLIGAPSELAGWEYDLIDSAASGTLGYATMAIDAFEDFHIAYLKGSDVMYVSGSFGEFSTPQSVFTGGAVTTAPRIALGLNSALDINIAAAEAGDPWRLWLIESENGMGTHSQSLALSSASVITQYDLAIRHDGDAVIAAYLDSPDNELTIWEERSGLRQGFASTGGMNAGVTLTLDEDMRYCATLADLEGTGYGYTLCWDSEAGDYVLEQFSADADGSLTMSQWRNEYGPYISYLNEEYYEGSGWSTTSSVFMNGSEWYVYEFFNEEKMPILHSTDPFEIYEGVFAYYLDADLHDNLRLMVGPLIE